MISAESTVTFGPFLLDPATVELWREGVRVSLEPLPAKLLLRLARNPGKLVERQELLEIGWPALPGVAEQSLNTCIHQIRQALGGKGVSAVWIQTVRGTGYRLVIDQPAVNQRSWILGSRVIVTAAAVVLGTIIAVSAGLLMGRLPQEAKRSLARAQYLALETGDLAAARDVLDSARRLFPGFAPIHAELAELNLWLGDREAAHRGASQALRLTGNSATAHRTLGTLALLASEWTQADEQLQRALDLDPTDTRTLAVLAFRRIIDGRFDEADQHIRRAQRIAPLQTALYRDAGLVYLISGRYQEAEGYCRETARLRPQSAWAIDCLFDVTVLEGRMPDAAEWGRRLMALYGVAAPSVTLPPADVVAAVEAWRLDAWRAAVGEGADPYGLALALAANGRIDESIDAVRAAAKRPTLGLLAMTVDPRIAALRSHSGFWEIARELRLPPLKAAERGGS